MRTRSFVDARPAGAALLSVVVGLAARIPEARADETPMPVPRPDEPKAFTIGSKPVWYLMGGATGGGTLVAHGSGYVGGEASVVRLREGRFVGVYGDAYYDFGVRRTYATSGLELGYKFVGIDAGGASRFGGERVEWGATGRVFFTVGVVSLYARYAYFPAPIDRANDHVVQIGGLVKIPFATWGAR